MYTFEQLLNQSLEAQGDSDMCKLTQRCQDRVLKVKHEHMERSKEETVKYTHIYIFKNDSYIAHSFQIRYSRKNLFVLMMFESIKVQMNSKQVNLMTV